MKDLNRHIELLKSQQVAPCPIGVEARVLKRISENSDVVRLSSFVPLKGAFVAAIALFAVTGSVVSFMSYNQSGSGNSVQVTKDLGFDLLQNTELVSLY